MEQAPTLQQEPPLQHAPPEALTPRAGTPHEQAPPRYPRAGTSLGQASPWVLAWKPPQTRSPSTSQLGVGLETPPGQTPQFTPWVWAWKPARHSGIPPEICWKTCWDTTCNACWDTTPLWTEFLTHTSENITLSQTSFAGSKYYNVPNTIPTYDWLRVEGTSPDVPLVGFREDKY